MFKLFLLIFNKCFSNFFYTERYYLNVNVENYFFFNILRVKERNFEVYLNSGNIVLVFLLICMIVVDLL